MANVTNDSGNWNVTLSPKDSVLLKTGGTYVDRDINIKLVGLDNYLDKTSTAKNYLAGQVYVGDCTTNVANAFTHMRNTSIGQHASTSSVTGTFLNGAAFSVNSDGSSAFMCKTFANEQGGGGRNNAVLRFYATRDNENSKGALQFAINTGTANTPTEAMYKNVAMVDDIPKVASDIGAATEEYVNDAVSHVAWGSLEGKPEIATVADVTSYILA